MLCCDVLQRDDKLMAALNVLRGFWGFVVLYSKALWRVDHALYVLKRRACGMLTGVLDYFQLPADMSVHPQLIIKPLMRQCSFLYPCTYFKLSDRPYFDSARTGPSEGH